jgi:hypothetical protein
MASATLQQAPEAPEQQEKVNAFSRVVGVIFSPKPTFQSIVRRPGWLLPTVLLCLSSLAYIIAFGSRPGAWAQYMQRQFDRSSRVQQLSDQQRQQALAMQLKITPIITPVIVVVVTFASLMVVALILWGLFSAGAGLKLGFKQSLGIVSHAWMPYFFSGLLATVVTLLKDPADVDLEHPLASNVGAFLPSGTSKFLLTFCQSLDIFTIWVLCLVAVGFAAIAPKKLKFGGALTTIVVAWLVYVLIRSGLTAAFS